VTVRSLKASAARQMSWAGLGCGGGWHPPRTAARTALATQPTKRSRITCLTMAASSLTKWKSAAGPQARARTNQRFHLFSLEEAGAR
jgi:hypothetical protein